MGSTSLVERAILTGSDMTEDKELARRALDLQARAKDYPFVSMPAYQHWSKPKLHEGESPALIAHLDAMTLYLLPEELPNVSVTEFEELLADLKSEVEGREPSDPTND